MKKNIIANFIGKIWGLFANFLFVPIYIKLLGFSSYSVISFTLVLAGIIAILDGGLTATLSREFARQDKTNAQKKVTYETLQIIYFIVTALAILSIFVFSTQIAQSLTVQNYSVEDLSLFLKIVSFDLAFQLLFRFYLGGLIGLNKQVLGNLVQVAWGVCRSAFVLLIIYYRPSLELFFVWQSLCTIIFAVYLKYILDTTVYGTKSLNLFRLKFSKSSFNLVKGFAGGMLLISIISAVSSQLDKILISKMISLETLGYYTLAVSIASILMIVVSPISTAVLPKLTEAFSLKHVDESNSIFKKYSLYISIIVLSLLSNIIFFDKQIIWMWTGDKTLVEKSYIYVPIISIAYAFMVLITMAYQVALANGYTKLNTILGTVNVILIVPLYYVSGKMWGALGICYVFMILQILNFFIFVYYINRKFVKVNYFSLLIVKQLIFPLVISLTCAYVFSYSITFVENSRLLGVVIFGLSIVITILVVSLCLLPTEEKKIIRGYFSNVLKKLNSHE